MHVCPMILIVRLSECCEVRRRSNHYLDAGHLMYVLGMLRLYRGYLM